MKIEIDLNIYTPNSPHQSGAITLHDIMKEIQDFKKEFKKTMALTVAQFQAAIQEIDAETTRIGDYIQQLVQQLNRQDLTEEQEGQILSAINAAGQRLKAVGISPEEPVPTDPLPELPV